MSVFSVKVTPFTLTYSILLFVDFLVMFNIYVLDSASLFGLLTIILYVAVLSSISSPSIISPVPSPTKSLPLYTLTFANILSGVITIFAVLSLLAHPVYTFSFFIALSSSTTILSILVLNFFVISIVYVLEVSPSSAKTFIVNDVTPVVKSIILFSILFTTYSVSASVPSFNFANLFVVSAFIVSSVAVS